MLAIRPALCIAVSALALQGCAGVSELAGTSMVPGFLAGDEQAAQAGMAQSQMMETRGPLLQSEQVMAMDNSSDMGTTFIQASDPIDAPPPPIAMPAAQSSAAQTPVAGMAAPQPAMAPLPTPAPAGRPMMLVPAPGETMASVQPPPVPAPVITPPMTPQTVMPQATQRAPMTTPPAVSNAPTMTASVPAQPVQMQPPAPAPEQPMMMHTSAPPPPAVSTQGREFIPASVSANSVMASTPQPGEIPLTPGQRNVLERFTILDRLMAEGLITRGERDARRAENIGAILPYSQKAPAIGLERDVPDGDAISARLDALKRSLEMRAITPRQHAVERSMILDALLSSQPRARAMPKAPPADIIEAAAMIGHMERLRSDGVISDAEFEAERTAIDAYFMTGSFSASAAPMATSGASVNAATPSAGQAQPPMMTPSANLGLHLASYRSQKAAEDGWTQISRKHSAQLGGLNSTIRRVELGGGRGTFYRLLAGPVRTRDQATSLCQQLKRSSQYCDPLSLGG